MRPDEHKAKESRKYQVKKKQAGDSSAAEIAEARKKAAKARDRGVGISSIRRRNGEYTETEEDKEERKAIQAKFSRRKITSNEQRYQEETEKEALERDAELGIDRETTDLVYMLENADEGSSSFFKFKDEQLFDNSDSLAVNQDTNRNMLQLDFRLFENTLELHAPEILLGLESDQQLVENALNEHPIVLDKPIVPAFSKNAKGCVLLKSQQPAKSNVVSEADGIYIRNDGSNHRVIPKETPFQASVTEKADDLDELLALDTPKKIILPKPGTLKKPVVTKEVKKEEANAEDEAWLDDILG